MPFIWTLKVGNTNRTLFVYVFVDYDLTPLGRMMARQQLIDELVKTHKTETNCHTFFPKLF